MSDSVTTAINFIQSQFAAIPGIRAAPNEPLDKIDPFPCVLTFEQSGTVDLEEPYSSSYGPQTAVIVSELHIQRTDLPRNIRQAMTFREAMLRVIMNNPNLGNAVIVAKRARWTLGPMNWNGIDTIGYKFEIDLQLELSPG